MIDNKKYELTDDSIRWSGATLYRIRALKSFGDVSKGDLGGFIEGEKNLSHSGTCWVYDNAMVCGNARVMEDARIDYEAHIFGNAKISKSAVVSNNAIIDDGAIITDFAKVRGFACVRGKAIVKDHAQVKDDALVGGKAIVSKASKITGQIRILGDAEVSMMDSLTTACCHAVISGSALISDPNDVLVIGPIGSRNDRLTAYCNKRGDIEVSTGCFKGTLDKFKYQVRNEHGSNVYAQQYRMAISFIKQFFKINEGGKNHEK